MSNDDDLRWCPPLRSTGSRSFPARSRSSSRGFLVATLPEEARPRQIIYESNLERQTALLLLARRDLRNLWDQPPAVSYKDPKRGTAKHVFDYLASFDGGIRRAIAVKPLSRVEQLGFRATLAAIREQMPRRFADEVVLVTERDLNKAEVRNAELLHMFRTHPDPDADQIISDILKSRPETRPIAEVVSESGLACRGFRAVFRAIYAGRIQADLARPITSATVILCPVRLP